MPHINIGTKFVMDLPKSLWSFIIYEIFEENFILEEDHLLWTSYFEFSHNYNVIYTPHKNYYTFVHDPSSKLQPVPVRISEQSNPLNLKKTENKQMRKQLAWTKRTWCFRISLQ